MFKHNYKSRNSGKTIIYNILILKPIMVTFSGMPPMTSWDNRKTLNVKTILIEAWEVTQICFFYIVYQLNAMWFSHVYLLSSDSYIGYDLFLTWFSIFFEFHIKFINDFFFKLVFHLELGFHLQSRKGKLYAAHALVCAYQKL